VVSRVGFVLLGWAGPGWAVPAVAASYRVSTPWCCLVYESWGGECLPGEYLFA